MPMRVSDMPILTSGLFYCSRRLARSKIGWLRYAGLMHGIVDGSTNARLNFVLLEETLSHSLSPRAARKAHHILDRQWLFPSLWGLVAFALYFYYAQFVITVGWNAIELIIAQHLLFHGTYATSLDYPSAITWRPIVPTLLVTLVRIFTSDPLRIYQIICGTSLGVFTVCMFASARRLWGGFAGHTAAFLTLTCPAITTYLINHTHSYSHIGSLPFIGLSLFLSVVLIQG